MFLIWGIIFFISAFVLLSIKLMWLKQRTLTLVKNLLERNISTLNMKQSVLNYNLVRSILELILTAADVIYSIETQ